MGGLTSKYLEEVLQTPPRSTHVLKSDPRSPSDDITRTPISVTDTPERNGNGTPVVKVLPFDPRSPSAEVSRTPLMVETKDSRRRPFSLKPSRLLDPETLNTSEDSDPRSPTSRVPRTPLSDQTHTFTNKELEEERTDTEEKDKETKKDDEKKVKEEEEEEQQEEKDDQDSISTSSNDENNEAPPDAPPDALQETVRLGLSGSNKGNTSNKSNPRGMLQAKQCRAIEEEYSKNQQAIVTQLADQENKTPPPSNTQFVESI